MAERYLIDTSVVIKYLNASFSIGALKELDLIIDEEAQISFITEIELQAWNPPNVEDMAIYTEFVLSADVIGIDSEIITKAIQVRRYHNLKLPDAVIAATAIVKDFILIADNDKDFGKVAELKYINPAKM